MEFGPEIKVDGKRPEWLRSDEWDIVTAILFCGEVQEAGTDTNRDMSEWEWKDIAAIRLPANHPHYVSPTPDERAVAPDLVSRMRKLIETMASCDGAAFVLEYKDEARAIIAALEPVVDEDLVIARGIMADLHPDMDCRDLFVKQCMEGKHDNHDGVRAALAALRHSRTASRDVTPCTREQFESECG